ncbi:SMP-30/gluconolactonase/LRE family protein [Celerinatantimonas sp. YJH-8]|uniref:SMP-30/gluconolactonase/LRE family protein n=1 Tax=Celerinatantimonas sp. YJH-8 TaxID=3228714 RepID=UPI0038C32757
MDLIEHRNIKTTLLAAALLFPAASSLAAPTTTSSTVPLHVERFVPGTEQIIPEQASLKILAQGYHWVEGPVWYQNQLLFSDIPDNTIYSWTPDSGVHVFAKKTGYQGSAPFAGIEPGSNGMAVDPEGRLTIAGHARRMVFRLNGSHYSDGITTLAMRYQGKLLNSPNDLIYKNDGSLYFTDPPYGLETQSDKDPKKQLKVDGVYRIIAASQYAGGSAKKPVLQQLVTDLPRPNGIAFSADEKYLYVSNSEPQKIWMRYPVKADGSLGKGQVFYDASHDPQRGNPDGMAVDQDNHLFSAGPGGVWVFSPEGQHLATLSIPEKVGNVTFGGQDRQTLFITATDKVYAIHLNVAGLH